MSTYNPLIPTGLLNLDVDYKNLQLNFAQINTTYGTDHVPLTDSPPPSGFNGYHKVVHIVPFSTTASNPPDNEPVVTPPTVAGIGELFTAEINDGFNIDEALFFKTGAGRVMQLTSNTVPNLSNNGYTFLPGGIILQWGIFNPNSSINVTFPIPFVVKVLNLQLTISADNNSAFRNAVSTGTLNITGFTWEGSVSSHVNPVYWMAIGF